MGALMLLVAAPTAFLLTLAVPATVVAQPEGQLPTATSADGRAYWVARVLASYVEEHPHHPPLDSVLAAEIELGEVSEGYVAPREGIPKVKLRLSQVALDAPGLYYASALATINEGILVELNRRGLGGVTVQTSPQDIDPATGEDRRGPDQSDVRVDIRTGRISGLRVIGVETFAFGGRLSEEGAAGNPVHQRLKDRSPIQPPDSARPGTTDLLRVDLLRDYLDRLNRHPGRTVVAEVLPSRVTSGSAFIDYKVVEAKPWSAYSQASRTGTDGTHRWRQRFGFRHTQLRGEDDIFRFDYFTGGKFKDIHGLSASYESPLLGLERIRWQARVAFSEFDASDIGINDADFEGRQHIAEFQLISNVFQYGKLFIDLVGELTWQDIVVKDKLRTSRGSEDMLLPRVALRADRESDAMLLHMDVGLERSLGGGSSLRPSNLRRLGRTDPDDRWMILRWNAELSFFIEPLLARLGVPIEERWRIHEIYLSAVGQYPFNNRLIPQEEMIVGGLYTVRGYPQAVLAGDQVARGTIEYRIHLPRLLPTRLRPWKLPLIGDFKVAPQRIGSEPDWDLVLSAFADLASVRQSQIVPGELQSSLFGVGLGMELRFMENFSVRYNFGVALRSIEDFAGTALVHRGDAEHHLAFTFIF